MKGRKHLLMSLGVSLLLAYPVCSQARIYKWYDESGKVHYSQSPPPKGGESASINTETFSSLDMYKAPVRPASHAKPKRTYKAKKKRKKRTTRSSCPLRR